MNANTVEIIGYAASLMVALSFTMKDIIKLRIVNCIGCLLFVAYGLIIDSWPVILANMFITGANIYYLLKAKTENDKELSKA
ncbi:YgjV family protein [Vibrio mangrovi]|uniref:YgjV family protein n=1 Tax=Vibrio mangrovi TaxID=474394 RepID=A0A1Y6IQV7_9VIBR|nr:YgjV family protein [Vibrio mangrovi]MDW6004319.1 YgjV family protein [Vibrio mangrovi]SMR98882.1 hypothetical protein VIM7927_00095 [Vibrio mangrovi]